MELTQTLRQTTRLSMTQHMRQSLQVLQMSAADLARYLEERAEDNPCLEVDLPRPRPRDTGPRPDLGVVSWDNAATLQAQGPGLYAHVSGQIDAMLTDAQQRKAAFGFLEVLELSGWMSAGPESVALATQVPLPVAEAVLVRLQKMEPAGLFARSLSECLRLQAQAADLLTWELEVMLDHLPLLAEGQLRELADMCDCEPEDIPQIAAVLRGFDPKPGLQFANDLPPVFPPDLVARPGDRGWEVDLTRSNLPTLRIADGQAGQEAAHAEAQALATALEKRQVTMLRVGAEIVRHQTEYFEKGPGHLRPLTLEMLARVLDLHPSTISRVCAGRMIEGPRGALPLRALFSKPVDAGLGSAGASQDVLADRVRRVINAETPDFPLSDAAIADALAVQGVRVARRTVAKYRDMLGIPPSSVRRRRV